MDPGTYISLSPGHYGEMGFNKGICIPGEAADNNNTREVVAEVVRNKPVAAEAMRLPEENLQ